MKNICLKFALVLLTVVPCVLAGCKSSRKVEDAGNTVKDAVVEAGHKVQEAASSAVTETKHLVNKAQDKKDEIAHRVSEEND